MVVNYPTSHHRDTEALRNETALENYSPRPLGGEGGSVVRGLQFRKNIYQALQFSPAFCALRDEGN